VEIDMSNQKRTSDVSALSDTELSEVHGGIIAHLTAAAIAGVIAGWDIAPGVTAKDAAKALGVEYLL
jgi:hypothetical protein